MFEFELFIARLEHEYKTVIDDSFEWRKVLAWSENLMLMSEEQKRRQELTKIRSMR